MKKLSICIPTYNRSNYLISQLNFLEKEVVPFKDSIEIIVADNLSASDHRDKLIDYHRDKNFFELKLNATNLGAIGNIYSLLDNVTTSDYVWFVSDDDILLEGVIERVMKILNGNNPISYLFLNYNAFIKNPDIIKHTLDLSGYSGCIGEGKQCVIDLFQKNGTISMFITSCVYEVAPLKEFHSNRPKESMIDPLLFSFKLALGPTYIENEVFVLERCDAPSWSEEGLAIFSWQVQAGLIELLDHSYEKRDVVKMINSMYASGRGSYIRMLLKAPLNYKKMIIGILGIDQSKLLFRFLKGHLYRRLNKITISKKSQMKGQASVLHN